MKKKINKKKIVITTASVLVVAAIVIGGFFLFQSRNTDPVDVYSVEVLNTSGWYEDESQLTGTITSDFIQEVYQDTSQQIKKVYVKEGDNVKVGDKLLKYNVDEKELDLQLQKLQIQSSQYQIEKMQKELETLKNTKATASSSGASGLVNASFGQSLLNGSNLISVAEGTDDEPTEPSEEDPPESTTEATEKDPPESTTEATEKDPPESTTETTGKKPPTKPTTEEPSEDPSYNLYLTFADGGIRDTVYTGQSYTLKATLDGDGASEVNAKNIDWKLYNAESSATAIVKGEVRVNKDGTAVAYADLYISEDEPITTPENDKSLEAIVMLGEASDAIPLDVKQGSSSNPDPDPGDDGGYIDDGYVDDGGDGGGDSGDQTYTADELKEAISEKESDIAKAKQELGEAQISYKEAKKEVDAATIKATVKGKVTTAYTKNSAPSDGSPMIVVKAEDGIYVNTEVSELNLDTVKVGGTITCTSYETNETYDAEVISVADYPSSGSTNEGMSNPNSSYYKVVAFIEDAGSLTTGQSVNVTYSAQSMGTTNSDAICLQKAYIRTEGNQSYVYKKGSNGRLEKQYIKTGSTVYGQYMEVLDGLEWDDQIAFPYGKNVKEGAKTQLNEDMDNIIY